MVVLEKRVVEGVGTSGFPFPKSSFILSSVQKMCIQWQIHLKLHTYLIYLVLPKQNTYLVPLSGPNHFPSHVLRNVTVSILMGSEQRIPFSIGVISQFLRQEVP